MIELELAPYLVRKKGDTNLKKITILSITEKYIEFIFQYPQPRRSHWLSKQDFSNQLIIVDQLLLYCSDSN